MKRVLLPLFALLLATRPARADADQQKLLSRLWTFATLNYLYCDVVGLMDAKVLRQYSEGTVGGVEINEGFLLGATILMQVPMSMIFLSTELSPRNSRIANIAAGTLMTGVQTATLFMGTPTKYYLASSVVEIATTGFITAYAAFAMKPPALTPMVHAGKDSMSMGVSLRF
jgi:hypothetical protein